MSRMKIKTTERGQVFEGTPEEIVNEMNYTSWMVKASKVDYMRDVSRRVYILTRKRISDNDARAFLYGLARAELILIQYDQYESEFVA